MSKLEELRKLVNSDYLDEADASLILRQVEDAWLNHKEEAIREALDQIRCVALTTANAMECLRGCTRLEVADVAAAATNAAEKRIRELVSRKGYLPTGAARPEPEPAKGRTAPVSIGILLDVSQILLGLRDTFPATCEAIEKEMGVGEVVQNVLDAIHPILDPMCGDDEEEQPS